MPDLRDRLHRYWIRFDGSANHPGAAMGCGVSAVDRQDAVSLIAADLGEAAVESIRDVVEDVDVRQLDEGHVIPNMGDPSLRGIWFPRP